MSLQIDINGTLSRAAHREIRYAERHTRPSKSLLLAQLQEFAAADRRKDESMALLFHELRSPLASIQNAVAVLRISSKDEALQQRLHDLVERQVRQISLLISSLYRMSGPRLESAQVPQERMDLRTVLSRAAETVMPELGQRQHQLSVDLPESSTWVYGNPSRLEQVFVNLLSNASKYSEVGGKITMAMRACDGHAVVKVRDFGIGIAPEIMPHIFDLFVRADTKAVRTRSGLGIGLALVRSIVDSHDGTVVAASDGIGQGSEFSVRLKIDS